MSPSSKTFLLDLLATPSPTGFEARGQRKWAAYARKFADRVESDAYGNAWATLDGDKDGRRLMFEAHADEIGYMVRFISKDGFIFVDRIGGSDVATARGRRVDILGDQGTVRGVIGNTAMHIRDREDEKVPKAHELAIDIGASSAKEVAKAGIRVGHPAVYADGVEELGTDKLCGRALDNRIGGYIIAEVIARLSKRKARLPTTVYAVNAVQEEIGGHGARMIAHRLMPDVAIVVDVTHATDTPQIDLKLHGSVQLGGGPTLTHGAANHVEVVQRLIAVAEKEKIPVQHEATSRTTGTDTTAIFIQQHGIPSALVSLPLRYMHSVVEMAHLQDVEHTIQLLTAFAESVKAKDVFRVKL
ncbi:M20/M25/M40 family metallo-hydrolase [Prosthecobacter sp.]|uniref:M20/M25/M40 family metallo-hydrolase n=1 Tax=Prosthecobacter sp. TaxID=1965333 RepID=UPI002ABB5712|nr:M20/M25/M40 family metallo-hydrolase [Prosthecobacter sp.]MDZ4405639.1 M20/M25/M40 family metallo-hydrolase [Prosthecobacter sp.]